MKFLYPEFLYAFAALAVPIIIHLFNFRRYKRIPFTNVAFLREVNERTQASSKIKHLLVLLSRLFLLSFLIMAFAQPIIPRKDAEATRAEKAVSVFVDNSFSMQSENEEGQLFLQALATARSIANAYAPTTEFQLLTHNFEGKHQRFTTRDNFLEQIEEIEITAQSRSLSEITSRQQDLLSTASDKDRHLFVVSDFQQYMCDFEAMELDTAVQVSFLPVIAQSAANVYVDSVWFETPFHGLNQQEKLNIRVRNNSDKMNEDMPMSLWIDESRTAIGTYNISAHSHTDTAFYYSSDQAGIQHGYVDIDDYPITFDDRYYFSYHVDSTLKVMEIHSATNVEPAPYFARLFAEDPAYEFERTNVRMIDYSNLKTQHFIVLNEINEISTGLRDELLSFVDNGGSVLLVPGNSIDASSLNAFTQEFQGPTFATVVEQDTRVSEMDTEAPFFANLFERIPRNMDLPKVLSYYKLNSRVTGKDRTLMRLRTGDNFLSVTSHGSGSVYVAAVPLSTENNNFARHAIFVASVLRMSELSRPAAALSYDLSQEIAIATRNHKPSGNDVFRIEKIDGTFEMIPEYTNVGSSGYLFIRDHLRDAGNYVLKLGDEPLMGLAFNYPRAESKLVYYSAPQLRENLNERGLADVLILDKTGDQLEASLMDLESGKKLWKIFVLIALGFVLVETLLLKFWKA